MTTQVNAKLDEKTLRYLEEMVEKGWAKSKKQAIDQSVASEYRRYKAIEISKQIEEIAKANVGGPSLTEALLKARDEEDEDR